MATTIDALGPAEEFEKAGFPRSQALGMARAIRDHSHETLATQTDLHDFSMKLEQKITEAKVDRIKWFAGMMIAQGAAIVALTKLLPGSG